MKKNDFIELMREAQAPLKGMLKMVPGDKLDWTPGKGFMSLGQVVKHMTDNWSTLKMMVTGEFPWTAEQMEEGMKLENMPKCAPDEAIEMMEKDLKDAVAYIENEITEADFFSKEITAPWGFKGEIWKAFMMMRDHQLNHKMQLHLYLKLLGQPVHTGTLYGM